MPPADRNGLERGDVTDPHMQTARRQLIRDVLGIESDVPPGGVWAPFARFESSGQCVGTIEAANRSLILDGSQTPAAGLRSVAVHPDWRGRGLFRDLMVEALAWCDSRLAGTTLLYTETPALYDRYGFRTMPQHAFAGTTPVPCPSRKARQLDLENPRDISIVETIIARRAPLSSHCALGVEAPLWIANVAKDDGLTTAYLDEPETLVVFEDTPDGLVIIDVIAPQMPNLATVIGAIGRDHPRVKTLFPPDALDWRGAPEPEETGLMIRGSVPSAMTRPFMFPPTAEF